MANPTILNRALEYAIPDLSRREGVKVLEAGCGSASDLSMPFIHHITGIDIDPDQLAHNEIVSEKILGDLQTYELPSGAFDLIFCVDVLEHVSQPDLALANLSQSLRAGGYLMIACPEPVSYEGWLASYTPMFMRRAIFFLLTGKSFRIMLTGDRHKTFFPTFLRPLCRYGKLKEWARRRGLRICFEERYDAHTKGLQWFYLPLTAVLKGASALVSWVTRGNTNLLAADYCLLLKKFGV